MMKKSKWLSIIAIVLVIACMATLFVGCNNDKEKEPDKTPDGGNDTEVVDVNEVFDKIITGYAKAIGEDSAFSAFNFATTLNVSAQEEGKAAKNYTIDFKLGLDLVNSLKNGAGANGIVIDIKEGNNQAFYFNYKNDYADTYAVYRDRAFMQVGDKKFNIKAVDVAQTVKEQFTKANIQINPDPTGTDPETGKDIYDCNPILDDEIAAVAETIGTYIKYAALAASNATMTDTACSFEINLGTLLDPDNEDSLAGTVAGFSGVAAPYLEALGIDLDLGDLGDILPAIVIEFDFAFDSTGKVTTAKADITVPAANMTINKVGGGKLIDITIPSKLTASIDVASLVVNGAGFELPMVKTSVATGAKSINALDLSVAAKINVKKAINMSVAGIVNLNIPAHDYTLKADVSIDPTALLGVDFVDAQGNFVIGNLLDALLGSATQDPAIDFINATMTYEEAGTTKTLLAVKLDTTEGKVEAELGAVGMGSLNYNDMAALKNFITGLLPKGDAPAQADAAAPDTSALEPVGNALKNLQVKIDANGLDVTFAKTKFNLGYEENGEIKYDPAKFYLEVAATAKITAEGIKLTAQINNGGSIVNAADLLDIDVEVEIKFADLKYGEAVTPFPQAE